VPSVIFYRPNRYWVGNGAEETALEALKTYESAVDFFKKNGHIITPMNPNNNGANNKG
jgi:hypothetical protein